MLKRAGILPGAGGLGLCALGVSLYYGYDPWRRYSIFRENFAMPFAHIHQLKGQEASWMSYSAWLSFTTDGAPDLAHPEDYRDVPCTTDMLRYHDPFVIQVEFLHEQRPRESFWLYEQYLKKLKELLPRLQCKAGRTNFRGAASGEEFSDVSLLVYDTTNGQVVFDIEDHLFY